MTRTMMGIAGDYCDGRLALLHEGGYAVSYVAVCWEWVLAALAGREPPRDPYGERWGPGFAGPPRAGDLDLVRELVRRHELGAV